MVKAGNAPTEAKSLVRLVDTQVARGLPSYVPVAAGGPWDALRGIYNYKSSNTRTLDQGIGNAMLPNGGITEHLFIGDSLTAGDVSGVGTILFDRLRAWPLAMRDQMANGGVPANGTGMIRCLDTTYIDPRVVYTGTWNNFSCFATTTVVGSTVTFWPDRSGTVFDLWYYDGTGGTVTIALDGATTGAGFKTFTANGAIGWKYIRMYGVDIIGGFSKIVVTMTVAGASGFYCSGGSVWTPNGGFVVHNVAQSGSRATGTGATSWSDVSAGTSLGSVFNDVAGRRRSVTNASTTAGSPLLTSATAAFTDNDLGKPIDQFNLGSGGLMFPPGSFIGARTSATQVTIYQGVGAKAVPVNALATLSNQSVYIGRDPTCVHIALGGNDLQFAQTDSAITTAIATIRARFPNSDVILHLPQEFSPTVITSQRAAEFQTALYAYATTADLPVYDWRDRVGTFAIGQVAGAYGDNLAHITSATSSSLGAGIGMIIGDGSGRAQTVGTPVHDNDVINKSYIDRRKTKTIIGPATTTAETVVLRLPIPANSLAVNDVFRYVLSMRPAASSILTVRIRVGATGTTADTALVVMSATAATNAGTRYCEGQVGVQAIGASATILGAGTETVGAISAAGTASATSGTFNSTVNNYVTVTVQNTTSTTTTLSSGMLEWL